MAEERVTLLAEPSTALERTKWGGLLSLHFPQWACRFSLSPVTSPALSPSSIYFRRRRWLRAVRKKGRPAGGGVLVRPGVHSGGARACGQPCSAATAGIPLDPPPPP